MPTRSYNTFYQGIKKDDFLTGGANFIEGNNITGLNTGYGATLGPKVNKQLLTGTTAARSIFGRELSTGSLQQMAVGCDSGDIYKLDSVDNTPVYTRADGYDNVNGAFLLKGSNYMYFAGRQSGVGSTTIALMQVKQSDFINGTFASANESFLNISNPRTPPMLVTGTFLYVGGLETVYRIDGSGVVSNFSIFNRYVVGITKHGTQFMIYSEEGEVAYWDGVSASVSANISLGFRPERVISGGGVDHIFTRDGDYYVGSGYSFQLISKSTKSNRLDDNSQYIDKLNFTPDEITGQPFAFARGGLFMLSADTVPGIYRNEKLIPGLPAGFHKSITQDNTNIDFDEVFTLTYLSKGQSKLYFGYQSGTTTFGVDYIDLDSKESTKDGYIVSDVFSGGTAFEKHIDILRFARSYASGNDYIKLYKRIDNGSWVEISLQTPADDTILRDNINTETDEWIDVQFKIEFHNEAQDENPPLLHELSHDYTIIKT